MKKPTYSADTSALMDAWVRHYPPDVFPAVWDRIEALIDEGRLLATEEVLHELAKKDDDLYKWAKTKTGIFVPLEKPIQVEGQKIINEFPSLQNRDATRGVADPWVIALARVRGLTVVTGENSKPSKPKIPDVCRELGTPCINLVGVFRQEGWKFGSPR